VAILIYSNKYRKSKFEREFFAPGHNATPMEDNNTLLERKRKKNGYRV